jgi:hypothetical protein
MEVKPELLKNLENLSEILDRINSYEECRNINQCFKKKNSQINQNQFKFMNEISKLIEDLITQGFHQIRGKIGQLNFKD